jgi:hypothetical protein
VLWADYCRPTGGLVVGACCSRATDTRRRPWWAQRLICQRPRPGAAGERAPGWLPRQRRCAPWVSWVTHCFVRGGYLLSCTVPRVKRPPQSAHSWSRCGMDVRALLQRVHRSRPSRDPESATLAGLSALAGPLAYLGGEAAVRCFSLTGGARSRLGWRFEWALRCSCPWLRARGATPVDFWRALLAAGR